MAFGLGGGGAFRTTVWDPWRILAQMATLQSAYYVSLGLWIFLLDALGGYSRSLEHLFKYQVRHTHVLAESRAGSLQLLLVSQTHGKLLIAAFVFNALTW